MICFQLYDKVKHKNGFDCIFIRCIFTYFTILMEIFLILQDSYNEHAQKSPCNILYTIRSVA